MTLAQFTFGENKSGLIRYKDIVYKLKMTYDDGVDQWKTASSVYRDNFCQTLENVVRAVLHCEQNGKTLQGIETGHFQFSFSTKHWTTSEKIGFQQYGKSLKTCSDMLMLHVKLKLDDPDLKEGQVPRLAFGHHKEVKNKRDQLSNWDESSKIKKKRFEKNTPLSSDEECVPDLKHSRKTKSRESHKKKKVATVLDTRQDVVEPNRGGSSHYNTRAASTDSLKNQAQYNSSSENAQKHLSKYNLRSPKKSAFTVDKNINEQHSPTTGGEKSTPNPKTHSHQPELHFPTTGGEKSTPNPKTHSHQLELHSPSIRGQKSVPNSKKHTRQSELHSPSIQGQKSVTNSEKHTRQSELHSPSIRGQKSIPNPKTHSLQPENVHFDAAVKKTSKLENSDNPLTKNREHRMLIRKDRHVIEQEELAEDMKLQTLAKSQEGGKKGYKRRNMGIWQMLDTVVTPVKKFITGNR